MIQVLVFVTSSALLAYVSRKSLFLPHSHGFYRFFAWESILALFLLNTSQWFTNPTSHHQLISWLFLLISIFLVTHGVYLLRVIGKPNQDRPDDELFAFEKTSTLVTIGAYKYIRHPLYSSLLFLTWGLFFKHFTWPGTLLASFSTLFLYIAVKKEESECLKHFGNAYQTYMKGTKRFVPFLF